MEDVELTWLRGFSSSGRCTAVGEFGSVRSGESGGVIGIGVASMGGIEERLSRLDLSGRGT